MNVLYEPLMLLTLVLGSFAMGWYFGYVYVENNLMKEIDKLEDKLAETKQELKYHATMHGYLAKDVEHLERVLEQKGKEENYG